MSPGSLLVFESPTVGLAALLTLLVPLSFAYAILEHRLFDVSFIIRQGIRYAVARRILLSLVPALIALMALDLYSQRREAVAKLFATRGTVYILLAGAALVAHRERHRWLDALDRRFFRERYDAQRLLRKVAEEIRSSEDFEQASAHVAARVHLALHPAFAVVLVRDRHAPGYHRIAGVPEGEGPSGLPADGKMVGLALVLGRPIEVRASEAGWLEGEVGPAEAAVLTAARVELLVPIPSPAETGEWSALLALGPRRSEEPYAAEDLDLLQAAAYSLGSLSGRIPGSAVARRRFAECPRCGLCFDEDRTSCGEDAQPLMVSALPRLLLGRYRINRRLGRGGMGIVYAAADQALARDVAVKVLRDELAADARAAERFEREARLAASFSHPNVVTVHDFGVAAGRGFLVMELLAGISLREELERERRLEPRRVLDMLGPVCAAVDAAHRRRFVHRDLKPENIFLARSDGIETPKVLDFGISKFGRGATASIPGAETAVGVLLGTPEYMAPEQLRGEDVQPAWDIWALAMVAHEMLTGHRPIPAGFGAEPGGPFLQDGGPSDRARSFFLGALSIDPANRPPSAKAFYDGLRGALLGGP
jgi:tRNA A-37 threonylcarbamoyl transferase component Bud32